MQSRTILAFYELVKAGLLGKKVRLSQYDNIDYADILQLAEEQSVVGLVTAGLDCVKDVKVPQELMLQFIGSTLQIEQRNKAMNAFIEQLIEKLRKADIYTLLLKGQGIAQCYEKPLWRTSGDVDLFLSDDNYEKAKVFLKPLASSVEEEYVREKHLGMTIDGWAVELHGTLRVGLSKRVDRMLDKVQYDIFYGGQVRYWKNEKTQVYLPAATEDVVYVFAHILQHFYKGGIGLRQICDWCRLMWTYKDSLNHKVLEFRIREAGLMSEWKAFYNLASRYLGMPDFGSGLMVHDSRYDKKADKICEFILEVGNFGHNRDNSYFQKHSYFVQKCISAWRRVKDLCRHATIFPVSSMRFFFGIMHNGIVSAARGE